MGIDYKKTVVNVYDFVNHLDGDVELDSREVREYEGKEYTILYWGHDGKSCIDVYETVNGNIEVYVEQHEDEYVLQDNTFSSFYTSPKACLRTEFGISDNLRYAFLDSIFGD